MKGGGLVRLKTDFLFTLALLLLFALTSLALVVTGANVYRNTAASMEENYTTRTALAYVAEKIRQNDVDGALTARDNVLCLTQYGEENACLYIYEYQGWLSELLIRESQEFRPEEGQRLLEVGSFSVESQGGSLYEIAVSGTDGEAASLLVSPTAARETN